MADRITKSEDRQDHVQQNEMSDKDRTHNTTLKIKAVVTPTLQKLDTYSLQGHKIIKNHFYHSRASTQYIDCGSSTDNNF